MKEADDAIAELVQQWRVRILGLCEAASATIRRADAVHPIPALQTTSSLWSRDPGDGLISTVRDLGIGFVASARSDALSSPASCDASRICRRTTGFATGRGFRGTNLRKKPELVERVEEIADAKRLTPAQSSIAWLLAWGEGLVPIPGIKRR